MRSHEDRLIEVTTYTQAKQEAIKAIDHLLTTWTEGQYVRGRFFTDDHKMCAQQYITTYFYGHDNETACSIMEIIRTTLTEVSPFSNLMLLNDRTDYHATKFYLARVRDKLKEDINIIEGDSHVKEE